MKRILLVCAVLGMAAFASQAQAGVRFSVGFGGYNGGPYYYGYGGPAIYYGPGYYPWYSGYYGGGYYRGGGYRGGYYRGGGHNHGGYSRH